MFAIRCRAVTIITYICNHGNRFLTCIVCFFTSGVNIASIGYYPTKFRLLECCILVWVANKVIHNSNRVFVSFSCFQISFERKISNAITIVVANNILTCAMVINFTFHPYIGINVLCIILTNSLINVCNSNA